MKAHISKQNREIILFYGLAPQKEEKLLKALADLQLPARKLEERPLPVTIGRLTEEEGWEEGAAPGEEAPEEEALIMSGLTSRRLDELLTALRQAGVSIPLKAMVTPTNRGWTLLALLKELRLEHEAVTKGNA